MVCSATGCKLPTMVINLKQFSPFHALIGSLTVSIAVGFWSFDYEAIEARDRQIFLMFYLVLLAAAWLYRFGRAGLSQRTQILLQFAFMLLGSMLCLVALVSLLRGDWQNSVLMLAMLGLPGMSLLWAGRRMFSTPQKEA